MTIAIVCGPADVAFDECICCGGSATLGGTSEPVIGPTGLRYCSLDCHDEWEDYLATLAEKRAAICRVCGSDNGVCVTSYPDIDGTEVAWNHTYERTGP